MPFRWTKKPTEFAIEPWREGFMSAIEQAAESLALTMEASAKANRPWRDDTGAARAGLHGVVRRTKRTIHIVIAHKVAYGPVLELSRAGRYAILWPTIRYHVPVARSLFSTIMGR